MRLIVPALVLCSAALGTTGIQASAQAPKPKPTATQTASPATGTNLRTAKPAKPASTAKTTLRETGKISQFDTATRMLTLSTSKGTEQFTLAPTTRIQEGSRKIDMAALQKLAGRNVTVSYVEAGGQKTVQSVSVSAGASRTTKKS